MRGTPEHPRSGCMGVRSAQLESTRPILRNLRQRTAPAHVRPDWKWAGVYRTTEKNIGIPHYQIRDALPALLGDVRYWVEHQTCEPDELAVRFHYRLVWIHPFANGNGRHARLMADVVVQRLGRPAFTWGNADIVKAGDFRRSYIDSLRAADKNDIQPLVAFARS
ncbi:mobile mystery protein B [Edaphobacter bradus]|uniref:mobile mystery protein B n=1 Tax=Edaphobacter bradus TaxID=2259016 RepID=UPI0037BE43E4